MKKHPVVQSEMGLIEKPVEILLDPAKPSEPSLSRMIRSESKYFYEGACFMLEQFERIRDTQKASHSSEDYAVRYLDAILGSGKEWRNLARAVALSAFYQIEEAQPAKKIPLELKGMQAND